MERVSILRRFGFSIFITSINIALLIFIYSIYQRNAQLSQNVPTIDHGKPLYEGSYIDLLEKNLVNNIVTNSHIYNLPVQSESKYLLLFVSTSNDCSTCVDQELGHIVKVFGKKMENIWLISDSLNFIKINYSWDDRIFKTKKLAYSSNEIREMFFYREKPRYILLENNSKGVFSMEIDAQYPEVTLKALNAIRPLL